MSIRRTGRPGHRVSTEDDRRVSHEYSESEPGGSIDDRLQPPPETVGACNDANGGHQTGESADRIPQSTQ